MVKIISYTNIHRTDTECGSDEDISCHVCGQCVHEIGGFDIRQDLETYTIVVCEPCRLEEYPTRDEALVTAINSIYESWVETSPTQEDYWESVQSKSNLFPETVHGMLDINLWRPEGTGALMATVYPCYYDLSHGLETDTSNPIIADLPEDIWSIHGTHEYLKNTGGK